MRDIISMACGTCQRRNYSTTKNRRTHPDRMELKKYCRWCRKHTPHKETQVARDDGDRGVALTARAPDSKSGGWGFESLHPCH